MNFLAFRQSVVRARGVLNWTQEELAQASDVALGTIHKIESLKEEIGVPTLMSVQNTLQKEGIIFGLNGAMHYYPECAIKNFKPGEVILHIALSKEDRPDMPMGKSTWVYTP